MRRQSAWPLLEELLHLVENDDEMDDAEMDVRTSPLSSFSNPFAEPAKAKPKLPTPGASAGGGRSLNKGQSMASPSKPGAKPMSGAPSAAPPAQKPKYKGTFVGQRVDMGGSYSTKPTAWQDKGTGQMRFGKSHPVRGKNYVVWDGNDWVSGDTFDFKAKAGKVK